MPFVSYNYEVLGKDLLDWMIWPANAIAVAVPILIAGFGLSYLWMPFLLLCVASLGITLLAAAYVLVFLAAAGVQVLLNQLALDPNATGFSTPLFIIHFLRRVPVRIWAAGACVPAAVSLFVFTWGVLRFNDSAIMTGIGLFLIPVAFVLLLAVAVSLIRKRHARKSN